MPNRCPTPGTYMRGRNVYFVDGDGQEWHVADYVTTPGLPSRGALVRTGTPDAAYRVFSLMSARSLRFSYAFSRDESRRVTLDQLADQFAIAAAPRRGAAAKALGAA